MNKIAGHIVKVLKEAVFPLVFFLIMFNVLIITRALILKQYGVTVESSAVAVISALIVTKVVVIANRIPLLNLYPKRPLIYNVILKTVVFNFFTFLFIILEELLRLSHKYGDIAVAWQMLPQDIVWPVFWARGIWIFLLLLFYCSWSELVRVIGAPKIQEIFFGSGRP